MDVLLAYFGGVWSDQQGKDIRASQMVLHTYVVEGMVSVYTRNTYIRHARFLGLSASRA